MRCFGTLLLVLVSVATAGESKFDPSDVDISTGNAFERTCSALERGLTTDDRLALPKVAMCTAYLVGLRDGFEVAQAATTPKTSINQLRFCLPDGVGQGQAVRVILKYIRDNPAIAHLPIGTLAATALHEGFPCGH